MMGKEEENTPFSCLFLITLYVYSPTIKLYFFHLLKSITVTRLFRHWNTSRKNHIWGAILWTPKNKTKHKITHRITWRPDKGFWDPRRGKARIVHCQCDLFTNTQSFPWPLHCQNIQQKQGISNDFKNKPGERLNAILAWKSATSHLWKFSDRMSRTLLHRSSIALAAVSKRSAPGKKSR